MAKLDSVTFPGRGCEHPFRIYPWEHQFKPLPAVYVVTKRVVEPGKEPRYKPIYLGVTDDLSRVFKNHAKSECFERHKVNTVAVTSVQSLGRRLEIAKELAVTLQPPCNNSDPY